MDAAGVLQVTFYQRRTMCRAGLYMIGFQEEDADEDDVKEGHKLGAGLYMIGISRGGWGCVREGHKLGAGLYMIRFSRGGCR